MKKLSSLSIFFPALNDAQSLPSLIQKAQNTARSLTKKYEIIIINDGSTDNTTQVLAKMRKQYPHLRWINHKTNRGYGAALISGFTAAKYDWIFYTDGDGQYDPSELSKLAQKTSSSIDVVNGYKAKRADPLIRKVMGSVYNWALHMIQHIPIRDVDCDFRLIRAHVLKKITLTNTTGAICLELVMKLHGRGARFSEIQVSHYPRRFGTSQFFRWRHLVQTALALLTHKY